MKSDKMLSFLLREIAHAPARRRVALSKNAIGRNGMYRAGAGSNPDRLPVGDLGIRGDFAAHRMSKKGSPSTAILPRRAAHMGEIHEKCKRGRRMGGVLPDADMDPGLRRDDTALW
ncbi:hypothetical protein [Devosia lucknowensis]|uniref:hypothetical protein n=1 Tax=Devosia lucknowensis TaxID=1096929 RepID=UPI00111CEA01|nr:hypothetical protein [Devosia lucknowensis]